MNIGGIRTHVFCFDTRYKLFKTLATTTAHHQNNFSGWTAPTSFSAAASPRPTPSRTRWHHVRQPHLLRLLTSGPEELYPDKAATTGRDSIPRSKPGNLKSARPRHSAGESSFPGLGCSTGSSGTRFRTCRSRETGRLARSFSSKMEEWVDAIDGGKGWAPKSLHREIKFFGIFLK